jgi:hypothetical protein
MMAKRKSKKQARKAAKPKDARLESLKRENARLSRELNGLRKSSTAQNRRLASMEKKLETRIKREEILMAALDLRPQSKKGEKGAVGSLTESVLKVDDAVLSMGKRMENMLSALKNHREYLIRLNKKVYRVDPVKRIEMQIQIMRATLSIMALSGFDINKSLFGEMKKVNKMLEKEDADLAKVHKRMATVKRKFDEEMERFDYESIFKKSDNIPGYR